MIKKRGSLLIILGLLLLAAALSLTFYNLWDAHRADVAAREAVQSLKTMIPRESETAETVPQAQLLQTEPEEEPAPQTTEETVFPALPLEWEMPTMELSGFGYIGILEVESLELSLPVMDQWDYYRLRFSPCRFAGSVYQDNLVICGHNYPQHFQPLRYAPLGTQIQFTDTEGTVFRYAISSFETLGPDDVEQMITGDWDLTLFTCDTSGQTRIAIRCDRIE